MSVVVVLLIFVVIVINVILRGPNEAVTQQEL